MAEIINGVKAHVLEKGFYRLTCPFGQKRTYTNTKGATITDTHNGVDLTGNPSADGGYDNIIAIAAGKVVTAGYSSTAGYYVKIDHGNGVYTRYMHMSKGSLKVSGGQSVEKGTKLGRMGETGNVTGRHLHFDVCVNGTMVDPVPFLKGEKLIISAAASPFRAGTYIVKSAVNVRTGPGTSYPRVNYKEFSINAQKQVKELDKSCRDEFPAGVKLSITKISGTWGKCPSGWVSLNLCEFKK